MIDGREITLATLTVLDASPPEIVDAAAAAEFDSITLRLTDSPNDTSNPLVGDTRTRRETIARLRHNGLGVLDVEVIRLRHDTDPVALSPVLESAAALGARHLLVVNQDPDEARATERFAALCEAAEPFGLRPVLEFMAFTATKRVEDADRVVSRATHPAGGVLVDALHLHRSGGSPADVARLASLAPPRFPYAQLCDAPAAAPTGGSRALYKEAVEHRLAPGAGELPLRELIAALPARIPLSIETPAAEMAQLPAVDRAHHVMAATRRLLAGCGDLGAREGRP